MRISGRPLGALKLWVGAAALGVFWAGSALVYFLDEDPTRGLSPAAAIAMAVTCLTIAACCLAVVVSPRARAFVLEPTRASLYEPEVFVLLVVVHTIIGGAGILSLVT